VALSIKLKEDMGVENILKREKEMMKILWEGLTAIPGLHILAGNIPKRLGVISFYIENLHYNLTVRLLNDKFGIQMRGGCSCAGTYGHYLLHVSPQMSRVITEKINSGDLSEKPGWVRLSIHPIMTNEEIHYIVDSIHSIVENHHEWVKEYEYHPKTNEYYHKHNPETEKRLVESWLEKPF
ncbi:MAG: aminotransferase class V-fold PLP-dependent enzyme, partial [Cyclobacteriaceae bacterium]|nr:aminotransferase class V-fold PLP-dependent enzyme [Cyclobacteriaceae bacterium]